jgi:hypothetical protein
MKRACEHCGVNFLPLVADERYCCGGCLAVAGLLASEGLEEFYRRRDAPGRPVGDLPQVDRGWAGAMQKKAEAAAQNPDAVTLKLTVAGMTCGGCVWLIEHLFDQEGAGSRISVALSDGTMDLKWSKAAGFNLVLFLEALAAHGYRVKVYRVAWLSTVPIAAWYLGLAVLFSLNAGLLAWLKYSNEGKAFATIPLGLLLNGLLFFSVFAGGLCWILWAVRWRFSRWEKSADPQA